MKAITYIRLSLLTPYIIWLVLAGSISLYSNAFAATPSSPIMDAIAMPIFIYVVGVLLWGIPYSLLAIILGIWSRNQEARRIARIFAFSPPALALLIIIQVVILFLLDGDSISPDFGSIILMLSILSIVYGYIIIGIIMGIYKILNRGGYVKDKEETPPVPEVI